MRLKRISNKRISNLILIVGPGVLIALLVASIYLNATNDTPRKSSPTADQLIGYAYTFLEDSSNASRGVPLDCSGFTREVFGNFGIKIPPSSALQYTRVEFIEAKDLKAGNLVFFAIRGNAISHVGICIDSVHFIHSPGRKKFVRTDSITHSYWQKYFVGGGKVNLSVN